MILVCGPFEEYVLPDSLTEAKGLHSLLIKDDIRQAVIDAGFNMDSGKFRQIRSSTSSKKKAQFEALWTKLQADLISPTMDFLSQRKNPRIKRLMSKTRWQETMKKALRTGYQAAFRMGLESSGVGKFRATVADVDREYVDKAVRSEMRYFNKVLTQIDRGQLKGQLMNRLGAYAETLKHVYYAGRIMGTPSGMGIDWIAPMDRQTCKGCAFLYRNSPYTKKTIPTTPRAGDTACLNRCRCRLVMRVMPKEQLEEIERARYAKSTFGKKLAALKAGKALS